MKAIKQSYLTCALILSLLNSSCLEYTKSGDNNYMEIKENNTVTEDNKSNEDNPYKFKNNIPARKNMTPIKKYPSHKEIGISEKEIINSFYIHNSMNISFVKVSEHYQKFLDDENKIADSIQAFNDLSSVTDMINASIYKSISNGKMSKELYNYITTIMYLNFKSHNDKLKVLLLPFYQSMFESLNGNEKIYTPNWLLDKEGETKKFLKALDNPQTLEEKKRHKEIVDKINPLIEY